MHLDMASRARFGLMAAFTVLVAALGISLFGQDVGQLAGPTPTPLPFAEPGDLPMAARLAAGTYLLRNPYQDDDVSEYTCVPSCPDYQWIRLTVPGEWSVDDWLVFKHRGKPDEVAITLSAPVAVYADPCHWQGSSLTPVHFGVSVGTALRDQVGRNATEPTNASFGGANTGGIVTRLELSVPLDLDISTCDAGEYRSWTVLGTWKFPGDAIYGAHTHHAAGQVDVVHVVDLDRRPLLIIASHMPAASPGDLAELDAILDSMFIGRW